jgi:hypothetical protein
MLARQFIHTFRDRAYSGTSCLTIRGLFYTLKKKETELHRRTYDETQPNL